MPVQLGCFPTEEAYELAKQVQRVIFGIFLAAGIWAGALAAQPGDSNGLIRGTVRTGATGIPLVNVQVVVFDDHSPSVVDGGYTDANGAFTLELPAGRYYLLARDLGFADVGSQRYDGLPCHPGDCDVRQGRPVDLAAGAEVSGLLFELPPAGSIEGLARRASDGAPIAAGKVEIWDENGSSSGSAEVTDGHFRSAGLEDGTYFVTIRDTETEIGQLHGGGPCPAPNDGNGYRGCDVRLGQPVVVRAGEVAAGIEFVLPPGAFLSGRVRSSQGGVLQSGRIRLLDLLGQQVTSAPIDAQGQYRLGPVAAGRHHLEADTSGAPHQLYRDVVCYGVCDVSRSAGIETRAGETIGGLDFFLHGFGSLTGVIENERTHAPIPNAEATLYLADGNYFRYAVTSQTGEFHFDYLPPGRYLLGAMDLAAYETQLYPGVPVPDPLAPFPFELATPLLVSEGGHLSGIRLRLAELGRLEGRVVDAATGAALPDAYARVYRSGESYPRFASADAAGNFGISLPAGTYHLVAEEGPARSLLVGTEEGCPVFYQNGQSSCDPDRGEAFAVAARQRVSAGVIRLGPASRLRGRIELEEARSVVRANLHSSDGRLVQSALLDYHDGADFDFEVPGGRYYLEAAAEGHQNRLFGGVDCPDGPEFPLGYQCLEPRLGTPVVLAPGEDREGIDLQLHLNRSPCQSANYRLCLGGGRFSVTMSEPSGIYPLRQLTRDAGTRPGPSEGRPALLKILDACEAFGNFWFFASGVGGELRVWDRFAGTRRTYTFDYQDPIRLVADYGAFATCGVTMPTAAPAAPAPAPAAGPLGENPCGIAQGEAALCLLDRFALSAEWQTAGGQTGAAGTLAIDENTGAFSFFGADNLELIVRISGDCDNEYLPRYHLLASGTTDVGFGLKVKDTRSGVEKQYHHPAGQLFAKIEDFDAFATCGD